MCSQGHTWNECRKLKAHNVKRKEEKAQQASQQTEPEGPSTYATAFEGSALASKHKSTRWIFDTGGSSQMTPNKDLFIPSSFKSCSSTTKPTHGGISLISGVGDIRLKCRRGSGGVGYAILRYIVLEGLEENLFSYLSVIGEGSKLQGK